MASWGVKISYVQHYGLYMQQVWATAQPVIFLLAKSAFAEGGGQNIRLKGKSYRQRYTVR